MYFDRKVKQIKIYKFLMHLKQNILHNTFLINIINITYSK